MIGKEVTVTVNVRAGFAHFEPFREMKVTTRTPLPFRVFRDVGFGDMLRPIGLMSCIIYVCAYTIVQTNIDFESGTK